MHVADVTAAALDAALSLGTVRAAPGALQAGFTNEVVVGEGRMGARQFPCDRPALVVIGCHHLIAIVEIGDGARASSQFETAGVQTQAGVPVRIHHRHIGGVQATESVGIRAQVHMGHRPPGQRSGQEVHLCGDGAGHDRFSRWGRLAHPSSWVV